MATITANTALLMTEEEISSYNALPDNLPETKLTAKQKELVNELYRKIYHQNRQSVMGCAYV